MGKILRLFGNRVWRSRVAVCGIVAVLVIAAGTRRATAQFTLNTEDRELSATANMGMADGSMTTGSYSNSVTDSANPSDMTGDSIGTSATASQDTSIDTTGFSGSGMAGVMAEISGTISDSTAGNSSSSFDVTFTVPVPTVIQLTGVLNASIEGTAMASFDSYLAAAGGATPTTFLSFSETLNPGHTYELQVSGGGDCGVSIPGGDFMDATATVSGSYGFTFIATAVPEPASASIFLLAAPVLLARRRRRAIA